MHARLLGPSPSTAIAVVGTWEPFLPYHGELLQRLRQHADAVGHAPLAIVLDPPPTLLQDGEERWPVFDDTATRLDQFRQHGIDSLVLVRFDREDLGKSAADFFELVCGHADIVEFWLRDRQILGQRTLGSRMAIAVQCVRRKVKLTALPPEPVRDVAIRVREHLAAGEIGAAQALVGRAPVRRRPDTGPARLAWRPGRYDAIALSDAHGGERPVEIQLEPVEGGMSAFVWPDDATDRVRFVAGPGDDASRAELSGAAAREAVCA